MASAIRHVVMWRLNGSVPGGPSQDDLISFKAILETMHGGIPGMTAFEVGIDRRRRGNSADVVCIAQFESQAALEAYHEHPLHNAIKPAVHLRAFESLVVDFPIETTKIPVP